MTPALPVGSSMRKCSESQGRDLRGKQNLTVARSHQPAWQSRRGPRPPELFRGGVGSPSIPPQPQITLVFRGAFMSWLRDEYLLLFVSSPYLFFLPILYIRRRKAVAMVVPHPRFFWPLEPGTAAMCGTAEFLVKLQTKARH